jgi:hypothetical protein
MTTVQAPSAPIKQIMLAKETEWGTAVAATKDSGLIITDAGTPWDREVIESVGLGKVDTQKITTGIFDPKLNLTGEFQHGRLLEYVFGTVAHAQTTSDWKHTFTVANSPPSATISSAYNLTTAIDTTSAGMFVESCNITSELNSNLKLNLSFVGKTVSQDTSAPTFSQSTLQVFPHALVKCSINGTVAPICQSASINITKTALRAGGLGSNVYQQAAVDEMKYEFSATLGFTASTYHAIFLGGTSPTLAADPAAFEFILDADNGVTLGSGKRQLKITLENCQMKGLDDTTTVGGITFVEVTGHGTLKEAFSVDNISDVNF